MSNRKIVVLITGCSQGGIGFALCEEFAAKGCIVYATARRLEAMEGFSSDNIHKLSLDVTRDNNVHEVVQTIIRNEGQIDVLVNNAGMSSTGPLIDIDMEEIIHTFDTNVFSAIRLSKAVIPHMATRKSGTIVNVGSIGGEIPVPWNGVYCSSKAALHFVTDTLYMECTPFNINVVLVSPGGVKSNIAANQVGRVHVLPDSLYKAYADAIIQKLNMSQSNNPMPATAFAQKVVGSILPQYPPRYITLAAPSTRFRLLQWLPRGWVLRFFWKSMGERRKKTV